MRRALLTRAEVEISKGLDAAALARREIQRQFDSARRAKLGMTVDAYWAMVRGENARKGVNRKGGGGGEVHVSAYTRSAPTRKG